MKKAEIVPPAGSYQSLRDIYYRKLVMLSSNARSAACIEVSISHAPLLTAIFPALDLMPQLSGKLGRVGYVLPFGPYAKAGMRCLAPGAGAGRSAADPK